jgi:hypothetical protein
MGTQEWLPGFDLPEEELPGEAVRPECPYPERRMRFEELMIHPLTRERKWQLYFLRRRFEAVTGLHTGEILSEHRRVLLERYTTPIPLSDPQGYWPSQEEVMESLWGDARLKGFKRTLMGAVLRVDKALEVYERAEEIQAVLGVDWMPTPVEVLLPEQGSSQVSRRQDYLYRRMVLAKFEKESPFREVVVGEGIRTVEQVDLCSGELLAFLCTSRPVYEELERRMQRFYPGWRREVVFRDELPPEEAYRAE